MTYSNEETMEWVRYVGLAVCGAYVPVRGASDPQTTACQLEPGHAGAHDPR